MKLFILAALVAVTVASSKYYSHERRVDGSYLVSLTDISAKERVQSILEKSGLHVAATYGKVFHVESQDAELVKGIAELDDVLYVEEDAYLPFFRSEGKEELTSEWGLDRLDQTNLPLDGHYDPVATGKDIEIFILSTGVNHGHAEFGGRADSFFAPAADNGLDCWENQISGTCLATVAGGLTHGVAKESLIRSVKIADCEGAIRILWLTNAVTDLTDYANSHTRVMKGIAILGGNNEGDSPALVEQVKNLAGAGYLVTGPAGDFGVEAELHFPGITYGDPSVLISSATDSTDTLFAASNTGNAIELWAPGVDVSCLVYNAANPDTVMTFSSSILSAGSVGGGAAIASAYDPTWSNSVLACEVLAKSTAGLLNPTPITDLLMRVPAIGDPIPQPDPSCSA